MKKQSDEMKQAKKIVKFLESKKAENISIYDLAEKNNIYEISIVLDSLNKRHLNALADECIEFLESNDIKIHHTEGNINSGWIIIDCFFTVINIFSKEERERLDFDKIFVNNKEVN